MTELRNFAAEVVGRAKPTRLAVVERRADGTRYAWTFGELEAAAGAMAAAIVVRGVRRGDVVMTVVGSRIEWIVAMVACFRIGAVVLPCPEQLRSKDIRARLAAAAPALIVADPRNRDELRAADPRCELLWIDESLDDGSPVPRPVALGPDDPALMTFSSGTTGNPKAIVHGQRYLWGQALQARSWLGAGAGDLVWCTASPGWSKAARNVFMAPWLSGAAALLHDARFDPAERLAVADAERVTTLCMSPTEYRMVARRARLRPLPHLQQAVAAGEALDADVVDCWEREAGIVVRDGYGQTETGQVTGTAPGEPVRPGSMGRPLPGVKVWIDGSELVVDPSTIPTFFLHYRGEPPPQGPWHTGDCVSQDEAGYLWFQGRNDDIIISSGYRIGPEEVESALTAHAAVADAAAVSAPDPERGAVVRAVVVLAEGFSPSDRLARELQDFVKRRTAPYKYPRLVQFAPQLPRTPSGKVRRAALRDGGHDGLETPPTQ